MIDYGACADTPVGIVDVYEGWHDEAEKKITPIY